MPAMTQNPESLRAAFLHVINLTCSRRCCIRCGRFKVYLSMSKKQPLPESLFVCLDTATLRKKSWASSEAAPAVEAAAAEAD